MDRKNFIKSLAGATAGSLISSKMLAGNETYTSRAESKAPAIPPNAYDIKRGVCSYSYQMSLYYKVMTLEECICELSDMGAYGFEAIGQAIIEGYPNPSTKFIDNWWSMMDKYGVEPTCYTYFGDLYLQRTRLTYDEMLTYLVKIFKMGKTLGFNKFRCLPGFPVPLMEKALPIAQKMGIWMGLELHKPMHLHGPLIDKVLSLAKEYPDAMGFIPDLGIFTQAPRPYTRDKQIAEGVLTHDIAFYIEDAYKQGIPQSEVEKKVKAMKPKAGDTQYIQTVYAIADSCRDPKDLLPLMPYCKHVHAKSNEMTKGDLFEDTQIDYKTIVNILKQGGFKGYLCSEYEGQRGTPLHELDEIGEVRRQQVMLKRLLEV